MPLVGESLLSTTFYGFPDKLLVGSNAANSSRWFISLTLVACLTLTSLSFISYLLRLAPFPKSRDRINSCKFQVFTRSWPPADSLR
jgi:hypothetical protein